MPRLANIRLLELGAAVLIAVAWLGIARKEYGYNKAYPSIIGLNAFPLLAWALGLFAVYNLYLWVEHRFRIRQTREQFFAFWLLYGALLVAAEIIGYRYLGIQNISAAGHPGLPLLGCLHAAPWMKSAYFSLGPIMFSFCKALTHSKDLAS